MVNDASRIAIVGAGAVGCYFGGRLARAGVPVVLIGRPAHVDAIKRDGLTLDTLQGRVVVRVEAATDIAAVGGAGLVLVSVKTPDTESTAIALAPHLGPETIVVSLQNGVDNAERMYRSAGIPALAAVVYVAVQMMGPGQVKHTGRGDLIVGDPLAEAGVVERRRTALEMIARRFTGATVPCRIADDLRSELWTKLAMNCAYNAISALTEVRYGFIARDAPCRVVIENVIRELVAVAKGVGVQLDAEVLLAAAWRLGDAMPEALSSTAQDLLQGKRTEIDSLNGYVAARAREQGIPAPTNLALHALVKLAETPRTPARG